MGRKGTRESILEEEKRKGENTAPIIETREKFWCVRILANWYKT